MKKTVSVILILIMLFCFAGCKKSKEQTEIEKRAIKNGDSIPKAETLSAALFKTILEKKDFFVDDYTESFNATSDVTNSVIADSDLKKYLVAANEDGISIEYMELVSDEVALKVYSETVKNYDSNAEKIENIHDYSTDAYSKCVYNEDNYRSITRIKNTIVLGTGALSKAKDIQNLLKELGY